MVNKYFIEIKFTVITIKINFFSKYDINSIPTHVIDRKQESE